FERAVPLLWNGQIGDSRVVGFAAATKFGKGIADGDEALVADGLRDLDAAIAVNEFFNVFDLIPVMQALPPGDPRFHDAFPRWTTYLGRPETLGCVGTQPEICANDGFAPRGITGALLLFGDVYAKGGDLTQATTWYSLANALTTPGYRF